MMARFDEPLDLPEFYPGSKQRRGAGRPPALEAGPFDGVTPKRYTVAGHELEFFTIGDLAAALGRKPGTLRKWETDGILPRATFQAPNPKQDQRARRRLYTRQQAEGIVRIARDERIDVLQISKTMFTERVFALFKELREAQ